jgi:hypothetical protein
MAVKESEIIQLKPSELTEALKACYEIQQPCFVTAVPGVGKSQLVAQVCKALGIGFIDLRLSIRESVDLRGVPFVVDGKTYWAVPAELPQSGYGILFLDELSSARPDVQVAAYQLVLDRKLGEYTLPDGWVVMAAGNGEGDGAVVHKMSSALNSRFIHFGLKVDNDDWCKWAIGANLAPQVIAFNRMFPQHLHVWDDTTKNKKAYPCPRTWEFVSKITKGSKLSPSVEFAMISGAIGQGVATVYIGFLRTFAELPTPDSVSMSPMQAKLPKSPSAKQAIANALAISVKKHTIKNVMLYLDRMEPEYKIVWAKQMNVLNPDVCQTHEYISWSLANADAMSASM